MADRSQGKLLIRVSGGIFTGAEAAEVLRQGADAVEFYTALVYRGWNAANAMARELDAEMKRVGAAHPADLRSNPLGAR